MGPVQMNKMPREFFRNHYLNLNPTEPDENNVSVQQLSKIRGTFKHVSDPIKAIFHLQSHACEKVYLGHTAKEGRKAVHLLEGGK